MGEAFFWGLVGASSLLVGAVVAYVASPSKKFIAIVMALGAGLLIGSVAFELIDEALKIAEVGRVGLFMLIGAATFTLGNWYLDKQGAGDRKDSKRRAGGRLAAGDRVRLDPRRDPRVLRARPHRAAGGRQRWPVDGA
jgi:zinc transporter, ZIP family